MVDEGGAVDTEDDGGAGEEKGIVEGAEEEDSEELEAAGVVEVVLTGVVVGAPPSILKY